MSKDKENIRLWESRQAKLSDLGLAASLLTLGFDLLKVDKTDPRRANFVFADTPELQEAINGYWTSKECKYFENIRLLKQRLYGA